MFAEDDDFGNFLDHQTIEENLSKIEMKKGDLGN